MGRRPNLKVAAVAQSALTLTAAQSGLELLLLPSVRITDT